MTVTDLLALHISPSAGTPIYKQIVEQVQRLIAGGNLPEQTQLPSVRTLAEQLEINPMTVSKAYNAMESMGLLERRPGIGMAVADNRYNGLNLEQRLQQLEPSMKALLLEAKQLDIDDDELLKYFQAFALTQQTNNTKNRE